MKLEDSGKIWFPGTFAPETAVRIGKYIFVLGKKEEQSVDYWVKDNYLCVDLHNRKSKIRIARRFCLDMVPSTPATLFGGFEKTKHADVRVVTHRDEGVENWHLSGVDYEKADAATINGHEFWKLASF